MSQTKKTKKKTQPQKHWKTTFLQASAASVRKLDPRHLVRQPVMFVVFLCAVWMTALTAGSLFSASGGASFWNLQITVWLWFTVLFANFAESIAENRGQAQAETLRQARKQIRARKLEDPSDRTHWQEVQSSALRSGDIVLVEAGEQIPADGEAIEGIASVDESAMTGESAPVIREAGGDRSAVTGGTTVLSDMLVIRITANPGEGFLDQMIQLVEGAKRQKTPTELTLSILLSALSLIFLLATATLWPFTHFTSQLTGQGQAAAIPVLIALLICLIPTTIGGLLSAIGIAGIDRMLKANVIAMSGRAVESAGDVDVLLLDKTGTITHGNRRAVAFHPAPQIEMPHLLEALLLSCSHDQTPEGRSILSLAQEQIAALPRSTRPQESSASSPEATPIPFQAETRMSGLDTPSKRWRKGAADAVARWVKDQGGLYPSEVEEKVQEIARQGGTPLVVAEDALVLGVVFLKDVLKEGIRDRFAQLRKMGIKTVMITGDNPLTAASIAAEAGVDDFLAEATPKTKLERIRQFQQQGHLVAMMGDGTNDAPALAQADVAVAMQSGTQAAKEAANLIDLDSDPTKLIEIVGIGKQLLMTRGALTTFSLANDVAKYFAILPAAFTAIYPGLNHLNLMGLHSPASAVLSATIFNALVLVALIPLALRGISYRPLPASQLLRRHIFLYGFGGVLAPFVCIKIIDLFIVKLRLVS